MQVYLVGGAVRDQLLGRPFNEHDYVVVGATPAQMLELGFSQVGADFPVFLHPTTHYEYALARTERKSGNGYLGFNVYAAPDVTLEQDLIRRDLTINAMAIEVNGLFDSQVKTGDIIDPYNGQQDLQARQLRHVSPSFAEDPVRVLRLARFASRYAPLGFRIAEETHVLVDTMLKAGELNHLVAERVWTETQKSLTQDWSDVYFTALYELNALAVVMPTLAASITHNPEQWQQTAASLRQAAMFGLDTVSRFALLSTLFLPFDIHESAFHEFCQLLKTPKPHQQFAQFLLSHFTQLQQFDTLASTDKLTLLQAAQALKDTDKLTQALSCQHIYHLSQQQRQLQYLVDTLKPISAKDVDPNLKGKAIGDAIEQLRLDKLTQLLTHNL